MIKRHTPLLLLTLLVLLAQQPQLRAQQGNRAALVIDFGDGNVVTSCVAFSEPEITGRELLERAGMALTVAAFGGQTAVCGINHTGCPASDCWCQCQGSNCTRWSYWHGKSGGWEYGLVGDELFNVGNGAVEGWRWGLGTQTSADPPPFYRFEEVCAVPPTPTPIPLPPSPTARGQVATAVPTSTQEGATATLSPTPTVNGTATSLAQTTGQPTATLTPLATATFGITRTPTPQPGTATVPVGFTPPPTAVLSSLTLVPPTVVLDNLLNGTRPPTAEPPVITVVALPTLPGAAVGPATAIAAVPASTAASLPTAVIARIGANAGTVVATPLAPSPASPAPGAAWLSYALFGLIALALGGVWLWGRRRRGEL